MILDVIRSAAGPAAEAALREARCAAKAALLHGTVALIAAIAFATGVVFCAWAAYAALAAAYSPPIAGLIVGAVLIVGAIAVLWWVLARISPEENNRSPRQPRQQANAAAGVDPAEAVALAEALVRKNPSSAVVGALVAGLAAGTLAGRRRRR